MSVPLRNTHRAALLLGVILLLAGCSRSFLTAPAPGGAGSPTLESATAPASAPDPPSRLSLLNGPLPAADSLLNWQPVVQILVRQDEDKVVVGHRWQLQFEKGSLAADALVTIRDYDANVLDVQFGPHGTKFGVPVTLTVDFRNTAADPGASQYDGSAPVLYWLNDQTNTWEAVPGRTDWVRMKHVVRLEHFSRYVVGGKAGWRQSPPRDDL